MRKKQKGYTLVELVVSMALFSVLTTLVIAGFLNVANLKAKASSMKESQQKLRLAVDQITRMAKEADRATLTHGANNTHTLIFTFDKEKKGTPYDSRVKYEIKDNTIYYSESCFSSLEPTCTEDLDAGSQGNLLSGSAPGSAGAIALNSDSKFEWGSPTGTNGAYSSFPAVLNIILKGEINIQNNIFYSDNFDLNASIIMENLI